MTFFNKNVHYTIGDGDGDEEYSKKFKGNKTHWGQLKLFSSELQALNLYYNPEEIDLVVYVGAATGNHLYVLHKLFPNLNFVLYDTNPFDERLYKIKNFEIKNEYFNNEEAKKIKKMKKNIFFISDIRSLEYESREDDENIFWDDMKKQESWFNIIEAKVGLLKFKLPYTGKTKEYLDGLIYRQIFQKNNSNETRLLVKGIEYRDWNIKNYEKKLSYHNQVVREKQEFLNPFTLNNEPFYSEYNLNNDFDSICFAEIIKDYLIKINKPKNIENARKLTSFIIDNLMANGINKIK